MRYSYSVAFAVLLFCAVAITGAAGSPNGELERRFPWLSGRSTSARSLQAEVEEEEDEEGIFKWTCVAGIMALAGTFIVGQILESKHFHYLPEAAVGVLMGILAGGFAKYTGNHAMISHERFDFEFFMVYLLPPIIFEAGFNMNVKAFVDNIGPTMFFAFLGTFASTFIVGGIVWYAGQLGYCYPLGLLASLVFGSLISATDPVTVLAVFQALGVKVDLFSMVFGESVLNDAVAIVLSTTLLSFNKPNQPVDAESITGAVYLFLTIFVGSLIIGLIYGVASALVFKKLDLRHHDDLLFLEAALSFTFPWAAYYTAEANHLSGIVTILFCGMVMATYTRYNFSEAAVELTARAYKCVALLAETYVFVYLGMAVFAFPIFNHTVYKATVVALLACFVGRGHIYIGSWLFNLGRTTAQPGEKQKGMPKISKAYMFVMWFSGLRGGVAFALASVSFANLDFPRNCGGISDSTAEGLAKRVALGCSENAVSAEAGMTDSLAIMQITLLIALFTIFVFGGAITDVSISYQVIEDKKRRKQKQPEAAEDNAWTRLHKYFLLPILTFSEEIPKAPEKAQRFSAAMSHHVEQEEEASLWAKAKAVVALASMTTAAGPTASEVRNTLPEEKLETALKGVTSIQELTLEDKVDEVRIALPGLSSMGVKKLLQETDENVHEAIMLGQSRGFS